MTRQFEDAVQWLGCLLQQGQGLVTGASVTTHEDPQRQGGGAPGLEGRDDVFVAVGQLGDEQGEAD